MTTPNEQAATPVPTYAYLRVPQFWLEAAVVLFMALIMAALMLLLRTVGFLLTSVAAVYHDLVTCPANVIRGVAMYYSMEREPTLD